MKKFLILSIILLLSAPLTRAQCDYFLPFRENTGMELQSFNSRDRLQGTQQVMIREVQSSSGQTVATIHTKSFDQRNRLQFEGDYTITCTGDEMIIDIQSMMNPASMEQFKDMELTFEGKHLVMPAVMTVGQSLPEAEMQMTASSNGMTFTQMNMKILNRKVEGRENVTVPAGTFECYKIVYDTQSETRVATVPIRANFKTVEYHAPNIGVVRSEIYDGRGRLSSYTVLSKIL